MLASSADQIWERTGSDTITTFVVIPFLIVITPWLVTKAVRIWRRQDQPKASVEVGSTGAKMNLAVGVRTSALGAIAAPLMAAVLILLEIGRWSSLRLKVPFVIGVVMIVVLGGLVLIVVLFNRPRALVPRCARDLPGLLS